MCVPRKKKLCSVKYDNRCDKTPTTLSEIHIIIRVCLKIESVKPNRSSNGQTFMMFFNLVITLCTFGACFYGVTSSYSSKEVNSDNNNNSNDEAEKSKIKFLHDKGINIIL